MDGLVQSVSRFESTPALILGSRSQTRVTSEPLKYIIEGGQWEQNDYI